MVGDSEVSLSFPGTPSTGTYIERNRCVIPRSLQLGVLTLSLLAEGYLGVGTLPGDQEVLGTWREHSPCRRRNMGGILARTYVCCFAALLTPRRNTESTTS